MSWFRSSSKAAKASSGTSAARSADNATTGTKHADGAYKPDTVETPPHKATDAPDAKNADTGADTQKSGTSWGTMAGYGGAAVAGSVMLPQFMKMFQQPAYTSPQHAQPVGPGYQGPVYGLDGVPMAQATYAPGMQGPYAAPVQGYGGYIQ
ncbi:MAG: hypothetical protein AAF621_06435 [Pseudomonadota bacterium]